MKHLFLLFVLLFSLPVFSQVVTEGLVAYYPFNGNSDDESGNNHHGTVSGAALISDRFGIPESAYTFDGIDDFISVPHSEEFNFGIDDPYSVSLWFIAVEFAENGGEVLSKWFIDGAVNAPDGYTMVIRYYDETSPIPFSINAIRYDGSDGFCSNIHRISAPIFRNHWNHVVQTFDEQGTYKIYLNGQLVESQENTIECSPKNEAPLLIGKRGALDNQGNHAGEIDDIRIYDRALSEEEVDTLYNESPEMSPIFETSLVEVEVFPNPTQGQITIVADVQENSIVQLYDIHGKIVFRSNFSPKIDLGFFPNGIYLLKIFNEQNQLMGHEKIVKLAPQLRP